jgi:hypothetical protein
VSTGPSSLDSTNCRLKIFGEKYASVLNVCRHIFLITIPLKQCSITTAYIVFTLYYLSIVIKKVFKDYRMHWSLFVTVTKFLRKQLKGGRIELTVSHGQRAWLWA